jgi:hypothetical protein
VNNDYLFVSKAPTELALPQMDYEGTMMNTSKIDREAMETPVAAKRRVYLDVLGTHTVTIELDKLETLIGCSPACDVEVGREGVSREHARIVQKADEFVIEDLESTNGTYVNSVRVVNCVLHHTDLIQLGAVRIMFVEEQRRLD